MKALLIVLAAAIGYLLGSINSSIIVGKVYGIDIRKHGSGNAGTTNTLRTMGKAAALFVLIGDILKGVAAYLAGLYITGSIEGAMVGGAAAILGHNWPVYFGFKGGKGVLTSATVVIMMDWRLGLALLGVFAIIVALTRYVSLGSIIAAALFPAASIPLGKDVVFSIFAFVIAVLVVFRHRSNIQRIVKGTESKLGKSSKVQKSS